MYKWLKWISKEKKLYVHCVQGLQQKKKMEFSQKSQHQFLKVINALECERTEEIDHIDQSEFDIHQIPSQTF